MAHWRPHGSWLGIVFATSLSFVAGDVSSAPRVEEPGLTVFNVQFEGQPNARLATQVLNALRQTEREYRQRLGFGPLGPVTVVIQSPTHERDTRLPEWADGLYDGTIRIPAPDSGEPTERLITVLRHELAHSFVDSRTRGNCPAWLQEGLSQWLEGAALDRDDVRLSALARAGELPALLTLEAPFVSRPEGKISVAYEASLSAAAHIVRTRGVPGIVRLLESLGAGLPSEEALPNALGMTYRQLQESWEDHLTTPSATGLPAPEITAR